MAEALHIFTSAAVNYLPKVRILCRSLKQHHPEAVVHLALADLRPAWLNVRGEPFDNILGIEELGIPNWKAWSFTHNIVELSTAIKPFALRYLLQQPGTETVLYFDPDMVLFSRVDDILAMLGGANIVLTPHQVRPEETMEAILDNEVASLKHGIFNLGFIGVRNTGEGHRFTDWWADRVYRLCRADVENGLFTDQKWINFAPVFFDGVAIVKTPRHNVATWNLTTRRVTGSFESGFEVDGEPLSFYHFTGFDSGAHRIMALKNAATSPPVKNLIAWYERELTKAETEPVSNWPWAFGKFSDGTPIAPAQRFLYRERVDLQATFPDPYDADPGKATFLRWCNTEGRLRYPKLLSADGPQESLKAHLRSTVSFGAAIRLLLLMFLPTAGKALRVKVAGIVRNEGIGGVARRLRSRR